MARNVASEFIFFVSEQEMDAQSKYHLTPNDQSGDERVDVYVYLHVLARVAAWSEQHLLSL
jgi:hypothetical protein